MRVICIDNKNPIQPELLEKYHWIYEGEIYTVIDKKRNKNGLYYYLSERNFGKDSAMYHSKRFIPLSEVDEMVRVEEEKSMVKQELKLG